MIARLSRPPRLGVVGVDGGVQGVGACSLAEFGLAKIEGARRPEDALALGGVWVVAKKRLHFCIR